MSTITNDRNGRVCGKIRRLRLKYNQLFYTAYVKLNLRFKKIGYGSGLVCFGYTYFCRAPYSSITIGKNVEFRSDKTSNLIGLNKPCLIATLRKNSRIEIGDNSGLSGTAIGAANKIIIGSNVMVGANSLITDTNWHNIDPHLRHTADPLPGEVYIGDNVFIGYGSIILKNVSIGKNSVIGAGSVVTKSIPANVIAAGNPCVVIRALK
ncbi:acyltransferase [Pedobacter sp. BS3]|uniref:acyltransferase n=1 Tax=Pedobacter sp. BS3 TaxID=2567937 RepID=UPI0011EC2F5D|nr:acyltransferase [Pedobacter sp. BS3]TZF84452.1 acyltransferase [Pedobacter sp. BS3]